MVGNDCLRPQKHAGTIFKKLLEFPQIKSLGLGVPLSVPLKPEASVNYSDDSCREESGEVRKPRSEPGTTASIKEAEEVRKEEVTDESVVEEKVEETANLEAERDKEEETPVQQGRGQEDLPLSQPVVQG
ncbi:hypothetical protein RF55_17017 [Lasius niger]|uniref:Uncharacterized protein n=1 Tax=Lasius niger TaxID=67767 RepID=A0A0J7K3F8_LASNI|nr:hypothetical protein RF55_17017 [Lasius niger]